MCAKKNLERQDTDVSLQEKTPPHQGVMPQRNIPGHKCSVENVPVQGFFSKYVPKQGVQYYRDLAGNIKQV